jgi:hypothetical protein
MASEEARQFAAQAWCTPKTSGKVMDTDLAEAFAEILDNWIEAARQYLDNQQYYVGLLDKIAENFGKRAYTSDDGSIQDTPLRAKMPELVAELREMVNRCSEI